MKLGMIAGAALLIGLVGVAAQTARPSEEASIRDLVREYMAARQKNDAAAIGALFTSDADQLTSSGEWRKGRDEIVRGTQASSKQTAGTRSIVVESVRFPLRDTAIADGRYEITGAGVDRRMWTSFVIVRTKEGWKIAAIRNMLPAPAR